MSEDKAARPLAGLTLLESNAAVSPMALRLANSFAGRLFADLGARVIKLEPATGDPVRNAPPTLPASASGAPAASALFEFLNCGKVTLRMPADPGPALQTLLTGKVDGLLAEAGDPALALARKFGIPSLELSGFSAQAHGDAAAVPFSEFTVLAFSGMLDMVGDPAREPLRLGGHQPSYAAGMSGFTALMALLLGREQGLPVDHARVSLVETMLWVNWKAISGAQAQGKAPTRRGAQAEFQVLRCRDGWVALVFTVTQFDAVLALLDDPRLREPKFATRESRMRHGEEMRALLAPWFAERTRVDIYAQAQARGVPLGPVFDPSELLADPQHLAREFIANMPHPRLGPLRMPRLPVLWGDKGFDPVALRESALDSAMAALRP
ncbi:MAG TPA: CoA transferase [Burkholderiaceae bacterium]|nr:CoA transferase [Burkholderiaceae bacterium]